MKINSPIKLLSDCALFVVAVVVRSLNESKEITFWNYKWKFTISIRVGRLTNKMINCAIISCRLRDVEAFFFK
jgi:hypothetical protein